MKNLTNIASPLNAYQIKWSIINVSGIVTKKAMKQLRKIGYSQLSNSSVGRHAPTIDQAQQKQTEAISILVAERKKGNAVIITDKQFGGDRAGTNFQKQQSVSF